MNFLAGGGELGKLIREYDWSQNPLGKPADWPQSLKTAVRIMLASRQPIWIGWGEELIYLYNDPYKSIIGGKHPRMLGEPTSRVWSEIWADIEPMLATAMRGVEGTYVESQLLIMERNGYAEETYYTFSYTPIPDEEGNAGGIICANTDDTRQIIGERQVALLRELGSAASEARTVAGAARASGEALATDMRDLPFALIYATDDHSDELTLAGAGGIAVPHRLAPEHIGLDAGTGNSPWPLVEAFEGREIRLVKIDLAEAGEIPSGDWSVPPNNAVVAPIVAPGESKPRGVLVAGVNPFRLFDDNFLGFISLITAQIGAALAGAGAHEEQRRRAESLTELNRAKTTFFSNISHEFRTPLTLTLGPIEELLDGSQAGLSPNARQQLEMVSRNGLRLMRLVNSLLDFSKIEAGRLEATYRPTDLAELTADLAGVFRSTIERAGLSLIVDCDSLATPFFVDRQMWEKVVLNLLSNAFKFTLEGEIVVRLRQSGNIAELQVRDTGIGVSPEEMPRLFERFHRVENAGGEPTKGAASVWLSCTS